MLNHFRDEMLRNGEQMAEGGGGDDRLHFIARAKQSLYARSHAADAAKLRYKHYSTPSSGSAYIA